jgi:WD40 repeat protein/tRNA A-37 threonylcarbamoyl transferase component Bud32
MGDYELVEEIARGGMGIVYKARQVSLNRMVAVKMIGPERFSTKESIERFLREAQAAAMLQHPNIVPIHEVGICEGDHFFSMDYVSGPNLAKVVRDTPLPPRVVARYVKEIAQAIHYAHEKGILHRDLKPSNVLIDATTDQPRVTDFGLAKRIGNASELTMTGQVLGTPSYMPPEQASAERGKVGRYSDVYSLGAILYHLLTRRPPFETPLEGRVEDVLLQVLNNDVVAPRSLNGGIPKDLETICLKCLEKEVKRRYPTALELADELDRMLRGEPIKARPVSRADHAIKWVRRHPAVAALTAGLTLVSLIGLGLVLWQWQRAATANRNLLESLDRMQLRAVEAFFDRGDNRSAFAYLADVLRRSPGNRTAGARALSALMYRDDHLLLTDSLEHQGPVRSASFSPDGLRVVTASSDRTARIWDARTGQQIGMALQHQSWVRSASFSPDGLWVVTASADRTARISDAYTGRQSGEPLRHDSEVFSASFSPDGLRIVTASDDKTARIWDARTRKPVGVALQHQNRVKAASFSPDGLRIVTASDDKTARIWDTRTGQPIALPLQHQDWVESASFSPDGLRVVTASYDKTARIWDTRTGQQIGVPLQHQGPVEVASFSPDGLRVVTASADETSRIWDAGTGHQIGPPLRHQNRVQSALFSPDGLRVVTASRDKTARIWDVRTGQQLGESLRHDSEISSASFSPDGLRVVTASRDKTSGIWDARTVLPIRQYLRHDAEVTSALFSPDGLRVLTTSAGKPTRIWDARTWQVGVSLNQDGYARSVSFRSVMFADVPKGSPAAPPAVNCH